MFRFTLALILSWLPFSSAKGYEWDAIVVDGKPKFVRESPLDLFLLSQKQIELDDQGFHGRLYTCSWEIRDSSLFLVNFNARIDGQLVDPSTVFDGDALPVLASWYTGKITVLAKPVESGGHHSSFPWPESKYVAASVYLVNHGKIREVRHIKRLRIDMPYGRLGFKLKRVDDKLIADPIFGLQQDNVIGFGHTQEKVIGGDIILGILDPNGFSMSFQGESEDLANAVLTGDAGNDITVILTTPEKPHRIQAVKVERKGLWRTKR